MSNFLNPEEVLKKIKLKQTMKAADFGCGSGSWVIPLAKKLELGKVIAIDLSEEVLSNLKLKLVFEDITNVKLEKTNIETGVSINDGVLDLVLMTNLLFGVENVEKVLQEGKRVLKKKGKILIIDWREENPIDKKMVVSPDKIKKIAEKLGLKADKEFDAGVFHYGIILKN